MSERIKLRSGECVEIGPAREQDMGALRDLFALVNRSERERTGNANLGPPWYQRQEQSIKKQADGNPRYLYLVARQVGGQIIGFMMALAYLREDGVNLEFLGVHPEHQKSGMGSAFLAAAENFAAANGKSFIKLRVSQAGATDFYRKNGYKRYGVQVEDEGTPDLDLMSKTVAP